MGTNGRLLKDGFHHAEIQKEASAVGEIANLFAELAEIEGKRAIVMRRLEDAIGIQACSSRKAKKKTLSNSQFVAACAIDSGGRR